MERSIRVLEWAPSTFYITSVRDRSRRLTLVVSAARCAHHAVTCGGIDGFQVQRRRRGVSRGVQQLAQGQPAQGGEERRRRRRLHARKQLGRLETAGRRAQEETRRGRGLENVGPRITGRRRRTAP